MTSAWSTHAVSAHEESVEESGFMFPGQCSFSTFQIPLPVAVVEASDYTFYGISILCSTSTAVV